jgi:hypothetical protein
MPVIGFLSSLSALVTSKRIASFGLGLNETGYVAGRDVTVEARMALTANSLGRRTRLSASVIRTRATSSAAFGG